MALLDALRQHPHTAIAGPCLYNLEGRMQRSEYPIPTLSRAFFEMLFSSTLVNGYSYYADKSIYSEKRSRSSYLIGACLLVKRQALLEVGGFDPIFFLYAEEADLSRRLREKGWDICLIAHAKAIHLGGSSGKPVPDQTFCEYRISQELLYRKHYGIIGLIVYMLAVFCGSLSRWMIYSITSIITMKHHYIQAKQLWRKIFLWNIGFRGCRIKDTSITPFNDQSLKINQ